MEELTKRKDIITNADKGGTVVIMDVEKYINKANCQLSDKRNYKNLQKDPKLQHSNLVNDTIDRFKKKIYFLTGWNFTFHPRYIKKTTQEDEW